MRTGLASLLCLTVGALLAGEATFAATQSADTNAGASGALVNPRPFPLPTAPGIATVAAQQDERLSTSPNTLGIHTLSAATPDDTLPPPSWVKPGVRLTFREAAASVAQSSFAWVEDPNGDWQDPATGTRYRRTDESGEGTGAGGGAGFAQIDVVAVSGNDVALSLNLYGVDPSTGSFVPGNTTGAVVPGGEIDGTWVNPTRLAQLQDSHQAGVLVLRGDYPLDGTTYHAISFAINGQGSYQQYTYDLDSGVLLSATTTTQGAASPVSAPGEAPPQGNTELTVTTFAGARQRSLPGIDGASPSWVGSTPSLDYGGTYYWTNPVDPSSGAFSSPMSMAVSLKPGGDSWASYTSQSTIANLGSTTTGSGITGPAGLYWLSPQALSAIAAMSPGSVLDKDPITGEQLTLVSTDNGVVTLLSRLPGIATQGGYDTTSGVLKTYAAQVPASGTTIPLQLQGGP